MQRGIEFLRRSESLLQINPPSDVNPIAGVLTRSYILIWRGKGTDHGVGTTLAKAVRP